MTAATTKTVKVENYSKAQTADLVSRYASSQGETVEALALSFGKSVRSIVAKLSREGVYVKPVRESKNGGKVVRKDEHASAIGAVLRLSEADVDSLTKANKSALVAIFEALANSKPAAD